MDGIGGFGMVLTSEKKKKREKKPKKKKIRYEAHEILIFQHSETSEGDIVFFLFL